MAKDRCKAYRKIGNFVLSTRSVNGVYQPLSIKPKKRYRTMLNHIIKNKGKYKYAPIVNKFGLKLALNMNYGLIAVYTDTDSIRK